MNNSPITNANLHVGDYGYINLSASGEEETLVYIVSLIPNRNYFVVVDRHDNQHLSDAVDFHRLGHLIEDINHVAETANLSHEILSNGKALYALHLDSETWSSFSFDDIYKVLFKRMEEKLRPAESFFHCVDQSLVSCYVRLIPTYKRREYSDNFDSDIIYPIINGALFNSDDEVFYDQIGSIEELNDLESDNGTGRVWQFVCSYEEGRKLALAQDGNHECKCGECTCGGCE